MTGGTRASGRGGKRKRVLLLAYACSPYHGSEPATGWHRAREVAKSFDTWVICEGGEFEGDIRCRQKRKRLVGSELPAPEDLQPVASGIRPTFDDGFHTDLSGRHHYSGLRNQDSRPQP